MLQFFQETFNPLIEAYLTNHPEIHYRKLNWEQQPVIFSIKLWWIEHKRKMWHLIHIMRSSPKYGIDLRWTLNAIGKSWFKETICIRERIRISDHADLETQIWRRKNQCIYGRSNLEFLDASQMQLCKCWDFDFKQHACAREEKLKSFHAILRLPFGSKRKITHRELEIRIVFKNASSQTLHASDEKKKRTFLPEKYQHTMSWVRIISVLRPRWSEKRSRHI